MLAYNVQDQSGPEEENPMHGLSILDCGQLYRGISPILGWVVEGELNGETIARALRSVISVNFPWLGGRLSKTEKQSTPFEVRIGSAQDEPFSYSTFEDRTKSLQSLFPFEYPGSKAPKVNRFSYYKFECLKPLSKFSVSAAECADRQLPLLHLHVVHARDASLLCIAWRHVTMDATGFRQLISRLEDELSISPPHANANVGNQKSLDKFTDGLDLDANINHPGWATVGYFDYLKLYLRSRLDKYWYPASFGSIYIPPTVIQSWVDSARSELGSGQKLSRNDIVAAWFYKTVYSTYPPGTTSNLARAVNLRERHPDIPSSSMANLVGLASCSSITSSELRGMPVAELASRSRESVTKFSDSNHVAQFAGYLVYHEGVGDLVIPGDTAMSRCCLVTSYVNIGLTAPNFGPGTKTVAALPLTMEPICTRIIDDTQGGWRIFSRLPQQAWEALEQQLNAYI